MCWKDTDSEDSYNPADILVILKANVITRNHLENCGVEYRPATAIAAAFPVDLTIEENTVINMPYSGSPAII